MRAKQYDSHNCWKCDTFTTRSTTMAGDFKALLCERCCNDWHLFIRDHPLFLALQDAELRLTILLSRTNADGIDRTAEAQTIVAERRGNEHGLFTVAMNWIED